MKKLILFILLIAVAPLHAQLKNINQLVTYSTESYSLLESQLGKKYWKTQETGKMDSLTYTRWIPKEINEKTMGDCFMIFYKNKKHAINYIVYQTINKDTFEKYMVEVKKLGFKFASSENKPDKKTDYYAKDKYGLSIIQGKEKPTDPLMYIFGIRILTNKDIAGAKPAAKTPLIAKPIKQK
jgi:hypothetical protein